MGAADRPGSISSIRRRSTTSWSADAVTATAQPRWSAIPSARHQYPAAVADVRRRGRPAGVIGRWPPPPRRSPRPPRARARSPSCASPPARRRARSPRCRRGTKDAALHAIADALEARTPEILEANARDMEAGARQRARRRAARPAGARRGPRAGDGRRACARSPRCPTRSARSSTAGGCPTASTSRKVRVPLGVVAVVYEARPNVTIDAAALCLKSGNAIVLRGSSSAAHSNAVLAAVAARGGRRRPALPEGAIVARRRRRARGARRAGHPGGRRRPHHPARRRGAEGGAEGRRHGAGHLRGVGQLPRLRRRERRPRRRASGSSSTPRSSGRACATRPRRCSSTPTSRRPSCPRVLERAARGRRRAARRRAHPRAGRRRAGRTLADATEEDWDTEFLALILAVGRRRLGRARRSSTSTPTAPGHSEAIVTDDAGAARAFERGVDAACVYVNASTRFTDGGQFGMGAEIGNSTQKLHARGPIGLRELCTYKYVVHGDGHVRAEAPPAPRFTGLHAWVTSASSAARSTRRTSGHLVCAQEARDQLGPRPRRAACPSRCRRTRRPRDDPGAERARSSCAGSRWPDDERLRASRRSRSIAAGAVVHGRYPAGAT